MVKPSWTIRRRIIVLTLSWCGVLVTYLAIWGRDNNTSETAINGCLLLMASVIGSYVFGAVWQDKSSIESETVPRRPLGSPGMPEPGAAE